MTADTPAPPKDSLYSLQPTSPSSVVILRKSKLRCPASACRDSRRAIFMAATIAQGPRRGQGPPAPETGVSRGDGRARGGGRGAAPRPGWGSAQPPHARPRLRRELTVSEPPPNAPPAPPHPA